MEHVQHYEQSATPEVRRRRQRALASAGIAFSLFSIPLTACSPEGDKWLLKSSADAAPCPTTDNSALEAVKGDLSRETPITPRVAPSFDNYHAAAKNHRLELKSQQRHIEALDNLNDADAIFDRINAGTGDYGFHVSTDTPLFGVDNNELHTNDTNPEKLRLAGKLLLEKLQHLPVELIEASGLKNLYFVDSFDRESIYGEDGEVMALASGRGDMYIAVDPFINRALDGQLFEHELGHLLHRGWCDGIGGDNEFVNTNPSGFDYGKKNEESDWKNVTLGDYAATNEKEDVAELYASLLYGAGTSGLIETHGTSPVIANKTEIALARLNQMQPGLGDYFITMAAAAQ